MIITQFFGIFSPDYKERLRDDTPLRKLTRLNISFGKIIQNQSGEFSVAYDGSPERAKELIERVKKLNPTAEIFLTCGGSNLSSSYGGAALDPNFGKNVLAFLTEQGFCGFDIDWEADLEKDLLSTLTVNLSSALHPAGFKITLDVWPTASDVYDSSVLTKTVDQLNIMSYGVHWDLARSVNSYVKHGFPKNMLVGGIETEIGYSGGVDTLGPTGTIATKATYAVKEGLAGMMEWRLDNDYTTIAAKPNFPTYQGAEELYNTIQPLVVDVSVN
jgi:GH18 family chitinase